MGLFIPIVGQVRHCKMESTILKHQETAGRINLAIAAAITMLPGFAFGALLSYLAMGLPQLQQPNPTGIIIDIHQISWLLSLNQPMRMIGTVFTGYLAERIGRKRSLILCSLLSDCWMHLHLPVKLIPIFDVFALSYRDDHRNGPDSKLCSSL
eukprot:TRINITY_DN25148_c0_g1_i1.p1 TRINITY_DN25148_c0_g1~~TRINITY_DN25148_c0_g1_i1.p1  ORF type:complete len:161 (-),score=26.18 TRINITY_DN25148_c0_g1_i1:14-472(-)